MYYHQLRGTSIGAPWAPAYACLHLGRWEQSEVYVSSLYLRHVQLWIRYIDDVLLIWGWTKEELHQFISELNVNAKNIKLTFTFHTETLSFLYLSISIVNCRLETRTFRKPTAANTLLLASSHHPPSLVREIPIGHFLCIWRNCSAEVTYRSGAEDLFRRFRNRGYYHKTIRRARKRASSAKREDLI